jgi:hypothetical protein
MNYGDSISDFFKSPAWMMNMLFGGICVLIPIVGPMVLLGWLITGFWGRQEQGFQSFPPFDFSNFGKYLERGLWPFLVAFAVSLVFVPIMWIVTIPLVMIQVAAQGHQHGNGCFAALAVIVMILAIGVAVVVMLLILVPLKIRAALTQDFAKAFDLRFVKRFIALTWLEMVLSSLFIVIVGTLLVCLGAIVFCVGAYFATVVVYFSWMHLYKQLYQLYLGRGGEPVPVSPKLSEEGAVA